LTREALRSAIHKAISSSVAVGPEAKA